MVENTGLVAAKYEYCPDAGWVVVRLSILLSDEGKRKLESFLQRHLWKHGFVQWTTNASFRLIARRGKDYLENLAILESWAKRAVKAIREALAAL